MVPRRITPGARARRALLLDTLAAIVLAVLALSFSAGLGVVAFFGLPVLLIGLVWIGVEGARAAIERRRHRAARAGNLPVHRDRVPG